MDNNSLYTPIIPRVDNVDIEEIYNEAKIDDYKEEMVGGNNGGTESVVKKSFLKKHKIKIIITVVIILVLACVFYYYKNHYKKPDTKTNLVVEKNVNEVGKDINIDEVVNLRNRRKKDTELVSQYGGVKPFYGMDNTSIDVYSVTIDLDIKDVDNVVDMNSGKITILEDEEDITIDEDKEIKTIECVNINKDPVDIDKDPVDIDKDPVDIDKDPVDIDKDNIGNILESILIK